MCLVSCLARWIPRRASPQALLELLAVCLHPAAVCCQGPSLFEAEGVKGLEHAKPALWQQWRQHGGRRSGRTPIPRPPCCNASPQLPSCSMFMACMVLRSGRDEWLVRPAMSGHEVCCRRRHGAGARLSACGQGWGAHFALPSAHHITPYRFSASQLVVGAPPAREFPRGQWRSALGRRQSTLGPGR